MNRWRRWLQYNFFRSETGYKGGKYRMAVVGKNVFLELGVSGNMNLARTMVREVVRLIVGVHAVFLGGDMAVIYIKQDPAVGEFDNLGKKFASHQEYCIFRFPQANCAIAVAP